MSNLADDSGWSHEVTVRPPATFAPYGTYCLSADEIYKVMRDPVISPNGLGSAIQMNVFYINRTGKKIKQNQKDRIQTATRLLQLELRILKAKEKNKEPKSEDKELWECVERDLHLSNLSRPVYPPPPKHLRIGGRNGYNKSN